MIDLQREKYIRLIGLVEELEEKIESIEKKRLKSDSELMDLKEKLSGCRDELQRVSNGCGYPHHH